MLKINILIKTGCFEIIHGAPQLRYKGAVWAWQLVENQGVLEGVGIPGGTTFEGYAPHKTLIINDCQRFFLGIHAPMTTQYHAPITTR
jgi:hypothetical protein